MAEQIIRLLLNATVTAGIAAAVVIAARIAIRRAPKRWAYMMWAVVFFRCLCPFSAESGFSLFNVFEKAALTESASGEIVAETGSDAGDTTAPISFNADDPPSEVFFAQEDTAKNESGDVPQNVPEKNPVGVYTILISVWVCGVTAIALYGVISSAALEHRLKTAVRRSDGVFESDRIDTAFTAGLFRPRIYLPCGLPNEERELIILHERVHIRRRDYILKPVAFAGLAVHWFNPLIWAAFALMTRDMEMSCDEAALRICGEDKRTVYSEALLNASVRKSGIAARIGFGETGIKERVKNVLDYKKPKLAATLLAAAVMLTACVSVGTDAKDAETDIPSNAEETAVKNEEASQSGTEAAENEETGRSFEEMINEDTSEYFPVNSKGRTYGSADGVENEKGELVLPDLIEAYGINGTKGYITKAAFLIDFADNPYQYAKEIRPEPITDEAELERYRLQYKDSHDDYEELQFIELNWVLEMYDSEGKPIDDVCLMGGDVYIWRGPNDFEKDGVRITICCPTYAENTGDVKVVKENDGEVKVEVDGYVLKKVFEQYEKATGKLEHEDTPDGGTLSHSDGDEAEDSKPFLYYNFGESEDSGAVHFDKWEKEDVPNGGEVNAESDNSGTVGSEDYYLWDLQREEEAYLWNLQQEKEAKLKKLESENSRQEEELQRLREEEEAKAKEIKSSPEYQKFLEDIDSSRKLKKPVDSEIIDPYAERDGVGMDGSSFHKGVDFNVKEGDTVCAADGGKVIAASDKNNGYGICVIIDHGNGMHTLYAHLSEASVSVDDEVEQGDEIGKAGHTGAIFGDGLHFEVRVDGQHVDPENYLDN